MPYDICDMGYTVPVVVPEQANKDIFALSLPFLGPPKHVYVFAGMPSGTVINTNLIKPGDEPKTWQDLLDPKWKGKMDIDDPRSPGPGNLVFRLGYKNLGEEYWHKFAAQEPLILKRAYREVVDRVAKGEYAMSPMCAVSFATLALKAGAPLKIIHLKEGSIASLKGVAVMKNGPNPNAAKVLLNTLYTKEAQTIISKFEGYPPLRKDVSKEFMTPGFGWEGVHKLWEETENSVKAEVRGKSYEIAKKIFKD